MLAMVAVGLERARHPTPETVRQVPMLATPCLPTTRSPHRARGHGPAPAGPAPGASRAGGGVGWWGKE